MIKPFPSAPPPPLADLLKAETWSLHAEAEKTGIVADIIRQRVQMVDYLNFIQNLREIYKTLESEMSWLSRFEPLRVFFTSSLFRHQHLNHDYETLLSQHSALDVGRIHPVTRTYCAHIRDSQTNKPAAMLAHIYVRYLGDLNGGQVLRRLLKSSLDLTDECLTFYSFLDIQDLHKFRTGLRETLNRIALSEEERDEVSFAAMDAFRFNIAVSKMCQSKPSVHGSLS